MTSFIIPKTLTEQQQLSMMQEDAKYDVADEKDSDTLCIPDLRYVSSKTLPKVPKVFLSNDCRFNCAYCGCRCTKDKRCYRYEPKELAELAVESAKQEGHGIFITSAIDRSSDYTQERIVETLRCIREDLHYKGYVHAKIMPGTDPNLIWQSGKYADRLSVNIEVAKSEGYQRIAKQKNKGNILTPMRQISQMIARAKQEHTKFAISQTTQLMAGSTGETDRSILNLAEALYSKFSLKRVYYTAFSYQSPAVGYDLPETKTPSWRKKRLYQADRLMQLYGFLPEELLPNEHSDLAEHFDPKIEWAIRNIHNFPIEINRADYQTLLKVPGIGIIYAKKILHARRYTTLTHDKLRKLGIPLKKSGYFIQCSGKYIGGRFIDRPELYHSCFYEDISSEDKQLSFL